MAIFPESQGQLIKAARGKLSQKAFAEKVRVDRSCLSRYENELLGAPTVLLNFCLKAVADQLKDSAHLASPVQRALRHAREAVSELENVGAAI